MKYGDLSSIVQLGVGLHVGTAVLQLYGELGIAPLERRITRIRRLFRVPEPERPSRELEEELNWVESRYELFKIEFFREYRWCVALNSIVALVLAVLLVVIALKADDQIADGYVCRLRHGSFVFARALYPWFSLGGCAEASKALESQSR